MVQWEPTLQCSAQGTRPLSSQRKHFQKRIKSLVRTRSADQPALSLCRWAGPGVLPALGPLSQTRDLTHMQPHRGAPHCCRLPTSGTHGPPPQSSEWSGAPRGGGSPHSEASDPQSAAGTCLRRPAQVQSDTPRGPGLSCPGPDWGLAFPCAWKMGSWATQAAAAHA